jgi:hypothetical protein
MVPQKHGKISVLNLSDKVKIWDLKLGIIMGKMNQASAYRTES